MEFDVGNNDGQEVEKIKKSYIQFVKAFLNLY